MTASTSTARARASAGAVNGGANAIAVAEHAIMLMLSALKHVHALDAAVRSGGWRNSARVYELYHSTVGIIGMGRIGQEVAQRLAGWEATIIYYDPLDCRPSANSNLACVMELDALLRTLTRSRSTCRSTHAPAI